MERNTFATDGTKEFVVFNNYQLKFLFLRLLATLQFSSTSVSPGKRGKVLQVERRQPIPCALICGMHESSFTNW